MVMLISELILKQGFNAVKVLCICLGFSGVLLLLYIWIQIEEKLKGKLCNFSLIAALKGLYTKLLDLVPFSSAEKKNLFVNRGGKDICTFLLLSCFGHCVQMPWWALGFSCGKLCFWVVVQGGLKLVCLGFKYLSSWAVVACIYCIMQRPWFWGVNSELLNYQTWHWHTDYFLPNLSWGLVTSLYWVFLLLFFNGEVLICILNENYLAVRP